MSVGMVFDGFSVDMGMGMLPTGSVWWVFMWAAGIILTDLMMMYDPGHVAPAPQPSQKIALTIFFVSISKVSHLGIE